VTPPKVTPAARTSGHRRRLFEKLQSSSTFDVVIIGGGVNGACLYDTLCRQNYKVLLVEKADFSSGTSQASGMMIWGGLLYLRNLDLASVFQLSSDRDQIIRQKADWIQPKTMRYLPTVGAGRAKWWVHAGLWLYWMMGMGRRQAPRSEDHFSELDLLKPGLVNGSLTYEEAFVDCSDARFVYRWIDRHRSDGQVAVNYCKLSGDFSAHDKHWQLELEDGFSGEHFPVRSRMIVNCAGIWTDQVNAEFGMETPFRHALSKGVYLGIPRPERHRSPLFFDLGEHDDIISLVPWGPISLWGPTETAVQDISQGLDASSADVDYLLEHYSRRFRVPIERSDIISVRCGIRPLVVDKHYRGDRYPLDLSRRQEIVMDSGRPWMTCYGGKMTGCTRMAAKALRRIEKTIAARNAPSPAESAPAAAMESMAFPALSEPVPSAAWCAQHESCCTLEDYLRRRTNIAQWIPRGGFGKQDENAGTLQLIALALADQDRTLATRLFETYRKKVSEEFSRLLAASH
jgi:glycerol-3-phosphate dehydrogenase